MYAFMTTGTFNFLKELASDLNLSNTIFMRSHSTTLLYAEMDSSFETHPENIVKVYPRTSSFSQENSYFHQITKPLFPDQMNKTYLQIQEQCESIFKKVKPATFKVLLNEEKHLLIILSQWYTKSDLKDWTRSQLYKELFNDLIETNKHFLHSPYTETYELLKKDTE